MQHDLQTLPNTKAELKGIIVSLSESLSQLEEENCLLRHALFASKSEKQHTVPSSQLCLFDMPENPLAASDEDMEEIVVPVHTRRKKGRKELSAELPRLGCCMILPKKKKFAPVGVG